MYSEKPDQSSKQQNMNECDITRFSEFHECQHLSEHVHFVYLVLIFFYMCVYLLVRLGDSRNVSANSCQTQTALVYFDTEFTVTQFVLARLIHRSQAEHLTRGQQGWDITYKCVCSCTSSSKCT